MKIKRKLKLHSTTQLVNEIDVKAVEKKVTAIPNVELQDKLKRNSFNIMKLNLETDNPEDIDLFIEELAKIIRDHGISRSSIEISEKIEIVNE